MWYITRHRIGQNSWQKLDFYLGYSRSCIQYYIPNIGKQVMLFPMKHKVVKCAYLLYFATSSNLHIRLANICILNRFYFCFLRGTHSESFISQKKEIITFHNICYVHGYIAWLLVGKQKTNKKASSK